ncbi:uncharacterized protein B0T15DRAFT_47552 [Chaetomium strumarium]|uniref:Uncharacterized protein n=1 Tax=Chaetomium strumarium TaxID=1170767 RepID=A0AAJ0H2P7_9PEZI|nr:hypothetical protein B0T15DRAFT_47552 [Chaetomium strumarium]
MMATIEPWLTNLLNKPQSPDLPPLQPLASNAAPSHPLSLPPLGAELAGSLRPDRSVLAQTASLHAAASGRLAKPLARADDPSLLHTASIRPLQLLLSEPRPAVPAIPLRTIVDDVPRSPEDSLNKKRSRELSAKEDLVQLPRLPKKQKSAQQVVPPIIAGLHEPPPDPAVFPPITSASFHDNETFGLASWKDVGSCPEDRPVASSVADPESSNPQKPKRRPMKPRRKWTEEETNNLLLGVSRHGVGRWTNILEDPDFKFNGRTAGDLKDRFRTCCPEELQLTTTEEQTGNVEAVAAATPEGNTRHKNGLHLEDILIPPGDDAAAKDEDSPSALQETDSAPRGRRRRVHRKNLEDLAELGIHGPFEKSHRRKRRPFTKQDDEAILDGLKRYGPSWTRIQRDPQYNLSGRQPTDLRDRIRNKYPDIYAKIEKAHFLKEVAREAAREAARHKAETLEPSVDLNSETLRGSAILTSSLEPQLHRSGSKEEMVRRTTTPSAYESTETLPALANIFDMIEPHAASLLGNPPDMDLSHLVLDDSHPFGERRLGHCR